MAITSLRARLLLAGVLGALLIVGVATALIGEAFYRANQRAFDRQLRAELDHLVALSESGTDGQPALPKPPDGSWFDAVYSGRYWQIDHGAQQIRSRSLWDSALSPIDGAPGALLLSDAVGPKGEPLRVASRDARLPHSTERTRFTVAADRSALIADAAEFRWFVAVTMIVLTLVLLGVLWYQVRYVLAPLRHLSASVADVRCGLATRLETATLPSEVAPLANHVNELLSHHERTVARARTAAQDLAHALKTPMSVLALEAANLGAGFPDVVRLELARMHAAVDRQTHGALTADPRERTPVAAVVARIMVVMERVHAARKVTFTNEVTDTLIFAGSTDDLEEMLGNLLDNAGKWATHAVHVSASRDGAFLQIGITDDGPGLPADQLAKVQDRGVRLDTRVPGSGIGLAIVRQIAESYGGHLQLTTTGGLKATLVLPSG